MEISQRDLFIDKVRFTFKKDQITLSLCHLHIKYTGMRVTIKVRLVLKVCRWLSSVKKEGERMGGGWPQEFCYRGRSILKETVNESAPSNN